MKFESSSAISKGLGNALETIADVGSLPAIRGRWYWVDPEKGADTSGGKTIDTAFASIIAAYAQALDGDGIALLSYGSASADTTSYLKTAMDWAKNGITVFGVCAPTRLFPRARISNSKVTTTAALTVAEGALKIITRAAGSFITDGWEVGMTALTAGDQTVSSVVTAVAALSLTVTDDLTASAAGITSVTSTVVDLITVSGDNNRFYNVSFWNGGSSATELGGLKVTGNRNYFYGCHIVGAANATPGAVTTARSLFIDGAQEAEFERCVIGTDTVLKAAANGEIMIDGGAWRVRFYECEVICYSATAGKGALNSVDSGAWSGVLGFDRCRFSMWNENGMSAADDGDSWFIGTAPTSGCVWLNESAELGWAAWDAVAGNDRVYVSNGAVHAATGGIAILTA